MKTIKIFLASSEELDNDRMAFGNLVRRLDDMYEKRGIRIKLFEWEDYDAAYNDRRKQDEYNDHVRQSDIFLALFHKKAGKFTIEEFGIASEEFREHASPKVYTYCKDLKDGEEESAELKEFKQRLFDEMGHYWCRYDNRESLQLQFVMQLQLVENSQMEGLKVENGEVTLDGLRVASMDKLRFAAANEDYLRMQTDLHELRDEIENMQLKLEKKEAKLEKKKAKLEEDPDDEDYQEEYQELKEEVDELINRLQPKLNKYNKLKEDFAQHQQLLFNTAKRVAQLQGERITERMRRAMDALTEGKVREANIILDEAESDARRNLEDYLQSKVITEQKRQNVISSIEELQFKASSIMSDASIPIEGRIEKAEKIYEQADEMAIKTDYEMVKFYNLLLNHFIFLYQYGKYNEASEIGTMLVNVAEDHYSKNHKKTAWAYNDLSLVYTKLGKYDLALEYSIKALKIKERIYENVNSDIANSYNNIGNIYRALGNNTLALEYYQKSIEIKEIAIGIEHPDTAITYNNIGNIYTDNGDISLALENLQKALDINKKIYGEDHTQTAMNYLNIGNAYIKKDLSTALKFTNKALNIYIKVLGIQHPGLVKVYQNLGVIYYQLNDYSKGLEYYNKGLDISEKVFGSNHLNTAGLLNNIGVIYQRLSNGTQALEYYKKALVIRDSILGSEHPSTLEIYDNMASSYNTIGDYTQALEYYQKAANLGYAKAQCGLGLMYVAGEGVNVNFEKAAELFIKSANQGNDIAQGMLGVMYENGEGVKLDYSKAIEWYLKAANQNNAQAQNNIGKMFFAGRGVEKKESTALDWFQKAAENGDLEAQNNLGWMYSNGRGTDQDYVKAAAWYQKAAEQGDENAYNQVAWTYHLAGKYDEALPWAEKAVDASPQNPGIIDTLATVYQGLSRYDEALVQFELCLKLKKEQGASEESIHETEENIEELKILMK